MTDRPILEQLAIVFGGIALAIGLYAVVVYMVILAAPEA